MNKLEEKIITSNDELNPSDNLKSRIMERSLKALHEEESYEVVNSPKRKIKLAYILSPILAVLLLTVFLTTFLTLRYEQYETVYIDVNPSMSLTLNRFDTVVDYELINEDAKSIFSNINFKNKNMDESLEIILSTLDEANKLNDSYINISATSKDENSVDGILSSIEEKLNNIKEKYSYGFELSKEHITKEDIIEALEEEIGPAKLRLINLIRKYNPDLSISELKDKTMKELKDLLSDLLLKI